MRSSNNVGNGAYAPFKERQEKLATLIKEGAVALAPLQMDQYAKMLQDLSNKVYSDTFKIQVVGTFKNGKSTFINAFLGQEILPAYATPCTAVINEVKYGDEKKAVLYFKNPLPTTIPSDLPVRALEHMKKFGMKNVPSIEIPYDQIEDFAVIPLGQDQKEALLESPYEKIELFWPLQLLNNGVEIIDSPGLNEHETRTRVTMDFLSKADAIIFVFTALALCSAEEMSFLERNLHAQGFDDLFFIINRFDMLNSDKDKERTKQYAISKLSKETNLGEKGIFFTSAWNALSGKIRQDADMLTGSGFTHFEDSLSDFLTNKKGVVKLSQPAKELKRILNEEALGKYIPQQRGMLSQSLNDLKSKYQAIKPKLADLQLSKANTANRINVLIEAMMPEISRCIRSYYSDLSKRIPIWIDEFEPQTEVSINPLKIKQCASSLVTEISDYVKTQIENDQSVWSNNTLQPLLQDKVSNMQVSLEQNLESFFDDIDQIRVDLSGVETGSPDIPIWQRVVAVGGGLLIGDFGVAAVGGITGLSKNFAKQIALQLGAYITLGMLGMLNPVTIIGVIIASITLASFSVQGQIVKKVKNEVAKNVLEQINNSQIESQDEIIKSIKKKIVIIGDLVVNSMDTEINELEKQVQSIISEMEKGQQHIDERLAILESSERKLIALNTNLDNFIFDLIK